jgi:hypothetical protein
VAVGEPAAHTRGEKVGESILLMSVFIFKTSITRRTVLALGLAYGGVLLAVKTETAGASGHCTLAWRRLNFADSWLNFSTPAPTSFTDTQALCYGRGSAAGG